MPYGVSRALLLGLTVTLAVTRHTSPLDVWNRWDTRWYTGVALHGYHWTLDGKSAAAFFPLYPLAIHLGTQVGLSALLTGMLLANVAFLGALFYLHAWSGREWGQVVSTRAVWLVAVFPTAFFTFVPYTESFFLLTASAALYYLSRTEAIPSGIWTALALVTRSTGVALIPALLAGLPPRRRLPALVPIGVALGLWLWFLSTQGMSLFDVPAANRSWHRSFTHPLMGFVASIQWLAETRSPDPGQVAENLIQMGVTVLFLALSALSWRTMTAPVRAYIATLWILWLTSVEWQDSYFAPFSSMDRFILALFPLAAWAAVRLSGKRYAAWLAISGLGMMAAAAVHASGGWVG